MKISTIRLVQYKLSQLAFVLCCVVFFFWAYSCGADADGGVCILLCYWLLCWDISVVLVVYSQIALLLLGILLDTMCGLDRYYKCTDISEINHSHWLPSVCTCDTDILYCNNLLGAPLQISWWFLGDINVILMAKITRWNKTNNHNFTLCRPQCPMAMQYWIVPKNKVVPLPFIFLNLDKSPLRKRLRLAPKSCQIARLRSDSIIASDVEHLLRESCHADCTGSEVLFSPCVSKNRRGPSSSPLANHFHHRGGTVQCLNCHSLLKSHTYNKPIHFSSSLFPLSLPPLVCISESFVQ